MHLAGRRISLPGRDALSIDAVTPEELRAVRYNQASFILSAAGSDPDGSLLSVFDMVNSFYRRWGVERVARVEISMKLCPGRICRRRYAVPVNPYFEMSADMMNRVLESMQVPAELLRLINSKHGEHIRMGVGIEDDGGVRKAYFSEGEKTLFAYGFRDDGQYGSKIYRMLRDGSGKEVMACMRESLGPWFDAGAVAEIFSENSGHIVYDRFVVKDGRETPSGFHISPFKKMRIAELREPLTRLARQCRPDLDELQFNSWMEAMSEGYLFWIGLGEDRGGGVEMALYARNIDL
jgi:hypothetical protein